MNYDDRDNTDAGDEQPRNGHNHAPSMGDCELCGNWSGTLRRGVCPGCTETHQLA